LTEEGFKNAHLTAMSNLMRSIPVNDIALKLNWLPLRLMLDGDKMGKKSGYDCIEKWISS
jgi:hypothetical protein